MTSKGLKTYLVGDFIFREGEQGNIAYVVASGVVELVNRQSFQDTYINDL